MCRNKINNRKAFTLAETLVAIIIMLLVTSIVTAGMPAAKTAYEKIIMSSNAEVLMSTAIYALRNEMTVARDIEIANDGTIKYISGTYGSASEISIDDSKGIMYQRYAKPTVISGNKPKEGKVERLVSKSASDGLIIKYGTGEKKPVKSDGYITFKNLTVYNKKGDKVIERDKLSIMTF